MIVEYVQFKYPAPGRAGFPGLSLPLSAQARTPSRPSGGDKEQKPAQNEGGAQPGRSGRPVDRANLVAFRHHQPSVQNPSAAVQKSASFLPHTHYADFRTKATLFKQPASGPLIPKFANQRAA